MSKNKLKSTPTTPYTREERYLGVMAGVNPVSSLPANPENRHERYLEGIATNIAGHDTDITALQGKVTTLESKVATLEGKHIYNHSIWFQVRPNDSSVYNDKTSPMSVNIVSTDATAITISSLCKFLYDNGHRSVGTVYGATGAFATGTVINGVVNGLACSRSQYDILEIYLKDVSANATVAVQITTLESPYIQYFADHITQLL